MPRADDSAGPRRDEQAEGESAPEPPAPTVVLLVRHGTTTTTGKELPGRAPGLHLADAGVRQAAQVAEHIVSLTKDSEKGEPPAAVYASPLERAQETAAPIAAVTGREVQAEEGLLELDVGEWTGLALGEAAKRPEWATIQGYPSGFTFPGGESFLAMQARMVATVERLCARHPGETVVAVSHADPIRALVAHAMGTHLDHFQRIVVSPGSLTAIAFGRQGPIVLTVNATGDPGPLVPS